MAYCAQCGITYPPDRRFCASCGSELVQEPVVTTPPSAASPQYCSSCGWAIAEGENFCPQCGTKIEPAGIPAPPSTAPPPMEMGTTRPSQGGESRMAPSQPAPQGTGLGAPWERAEPVEFTPPEKPESAPSTTAPLLSEASQPAQATEGSEQGPSQAPFPIEEQPASAPLEEPPSSGPKRRGIPGVLVVAVILLLAIILGGLMMWRRYKTKSAAEQLAQQTQKEVGAGAAPASEINTLDERTKDTLGRMNAILTAIETYKNARKKLPASLQDLGKIMNDPQMRSDGWGNPLIYLVDLSNNTFVLISTGPDGKRDTADDIRVSDDKLAAWRDQHHEVLDEWRVANLDLYQALSGELISSETQAALEKRKLEREKAKAELAAQQAAQSAAQKLRDDEARKQQEEATRLADQLKQQQEAQRRVEEERARQLAEAERKARLEKINFVETFSPGLSRWAAANFQSVTDKGKPAMRIAGFGLLRDGSDWDNYTATFDVKIHKEAVNFIIRASDRQNFYFLKLTDDKSRDFPKNSLIKFIYVGGKYLVGPGANEAAGAYAVVPLPMKIKQNDSYHVVVSASGNTIRTTINGQSVDTWQDNTFKRGSFGFNCSEKEQATVTSFQLRAN